MYIVSIAVMRDTFPMRSWLGTLRLQKPFSTQSKPRAFKSISTVLALLERISEGESGPAFKSAMG